MMTTIMPEAILMAAEKMSAGGKHPLTAMFGRDETANGVGYVIYCFFEIPENKTVDGFKVVFNSNGSLEYDSITHIIPAAAWYEREIKDMFGLVPKGHPDLRPLVLHETFPEDFFPLRKNVKVNAKVRGERQFKVRTAKGEGLFEVPVGPIHAGIIEPGHFRFSQAGEAMLQLDAKLFYTHRGIEKTVEGKTPYEALPIVERICGACSVSNTWSFCQAVEKAVSVKVTRRAEIIRTLLMELERITNHVGDIGNIPAGVGFNPAISLGGRLKEKLMRLNESVAGNRFLRGMIIPGGVSMDITPELCELIHQVMDEVADGVEDMSTMFHEQENFQNRIQTTGIVRSQTAIDLAMVGVGARASGYSHDSRCDFSYGVYDELDFKPYTKTMGDVAARLLVRIGELSASFEMVDKLIELLNDCGEQELSVAMEYIEGSGWGISESARGSNFQYVALDGDGRIDRLFVRSASYANWPALPIAVQGDIIPDFPLINKSFELCYACIDR
ncbi:NADH-quinone oxidoreductase subunit C [Anaerovibrio lipolyticus]|uniref:hydrogenase large subunit n=1 Tax=Anaerovibrio lipolyticus TaxID=82374 RepID=UPI0025EAC283|nr:NADH-quinone oxidoreductase subunit C [Anaerovibrio lipolyticus]